MSRWRSSLVFFALLSVATTIPAQENNGVYIERVLEAIQQGLTDANNRLSDDSNLPTLTSVELMLQTTLSKGASGGFGLWILSADAGMTTTDATTLSLKLKPPVLTDQATSSTEIAKTLSDMVVSAAKATYTLRDRPTPLLLEELVAELKFVVETSGEGGLGFTLSPVSLNLGGKFNSGSVQVLRVVYQREK